MPKLKALSLLLIVLAVVSLACSSSKSGSSASTATLSPATTLTPAAAGQAASTATQSPATTQTPAAAKGVLVTVHVDFSGATTAQSPLSSTVTVAANSTAWDAVRQAIGEQHITYSDYGGTLGIFITAFYDVTPSGNKYWEFDVNGKSSDVGVSTYIVKDKDVIDFKIAS